MKEENKQLWIAVATITGTIMGAGFLGIPYVVAKSGFLIGFVWMILICFMMIFVNSILGEIILSTKNQHHIPGYASKYLGKGTKFYVFIVLLFLIYSVLVAYLIGEGNSLSFIFTGTTEYSLIAGITFWILMAFLTSGGIRKFKKIEPVAVLAVFIVALFLGIFNFYKIDGSNFLYLDMGNMFLPFGVILFSFLGITAIPETRRILKKKELMKKAIYIGCFIPLLAYTLFVLVVLGLHGNEVTEIATIALGRSFTFLGVLTMFGAFLALSLALQDAYRFDLGFSKRKAWAFSIFLPLISFIIIEYFQLAGFVKMLSIGGAISGGILCITILLIHQNIVERNVKRERKPEFKVNLPLLVKIIFIILFIVGIVYEFL